GGFSAVHLNGSQEPLWAGGESLYQGYIVKSIQAMVFLAFMDNFRSPTNSLVRFVADQALGSLAYNAVDITKFLTSLASQHALDDVLPKDIRCQQLAQNDLVYSLAAKGAIQAIEGIHSAHKTVEAVGNLGKLMDGTTDLKEVVQNLVQSRLE